MPAEPGRGFLGKRGASKEQPAERSVPKAVRSQASSLGFDIKPNEKDDTGRVRAFALIRKKGGARAFFDGLSAVKKFLQAAAVGRRFGLWKERALMRIARLVSEMDLGSKRL